MENSRDFLTIVDQSHVLRKILSLISIEDCCNLSITSSHLCDKMETLKCNKSVTSYNNEFTLKAQFSRGNNFWEPTKTGTTFPNHNFFKICHFIIDGDSYLFATEDHKRIGNEMNQILRGSSDFNELRIEFSLSNCFGRQIHDMISQINNSRIAKIIFSFNEDTKVTNLGNVFKGVFWRFKKVKEIVLDICDESHLPYIKLLGDCITNVKAKTKVSICFDTSVGESFYNKFKDYLKYMLARKIPLSLHEKSFTIRNYMLGIFGSMESKSLLFITKLSIHACLNMFLERYSNFLSKMKNLEYLAIYFYGIKKGWNYIYGQNEEAYNMVGCYGVKKNWNEICNRDDPRYITAKISSMKSLKKLKTLSFNYLPSGESDFLSRLTSNFTVWSFLENISSSVKSLRLSGFDTIDRITCFKVNKLFPFLRTLELSSIRVIEAGCLREFKKLEFFITDQVNIPFIPKNIETCMVMKNKNFSENQVTKKSSVVDRKYSIIKEHFSKEYLYGDFGDWSIFFNKFSSAKGVIHNFRELRSYHCFNR
uniref:F-box domain-containing protein n=1 Tax=Strongyloides venezuelensis TaxID=75913 RepID=A0A0K0EYA3_STRVS